MIDASEARVGCRHCGHSFFGHSKQFFGGMRSYNCPNCSKRVVYPLTRGWRAFWWVFAIVTAAAGVWANVTLHEGYSWVPGGLGLLSFVVLCLDVGVRRRVDAAEQAALVSAAAESDTPASARVVAAVSAPPSYIAGLTVVITLAMLSSAVGALIVAGLNNAYSYTVVLQEAEPATTQPGFGSSVNLASGGGDLCGDGDDYTGCLNMHVAMYNSVCVGVSLTATAQSTCSSLSAFIEDVRIQADGCGSGCTTQADEQGRWGWAYLRPAPAPTMVSNDNALPELSYERYCLFSLGPVQVGDCGETF